MWAECPICNEIKIDTSWYLILFDPYCDPLLSYDVIHHTHMNQTHTWGMAKNVRHSWLGQRAKKSRQDGITSKPSVNSSLRQARPLRSPCGQVNSRTSEVYLLHTYHGIHRACRVKPFRGYWIQIDYIQSGVKRLLRQNRSNTISRYDTIAKKKKIEYKLMLLRHCIIKIDYIRSC